MAVMTTLSDLVFENRFTASLPADPIEDNTRRQVVGAAYSRVTPKRVRSPELVALSSETAADLGLAEEACHSPEFAEVFSGNRVLDGMDPHAACYGGHQFGHWAGQLGDGRAINLGEVRCPDGRLRMLQLKGAGPTPYSRTADGLAVLRSSVREFLCSEAMHHLGIPTTRALSLVTTGESVLRDMFYDGRPEREPGAVVCRVSTSFIRFGSFQILAARRDEALLRRLVDFVVATEYPDLEDAGDGIVLAWFAEVVDRTMALVRHWERVGFVHGVMNTDNMSILGETIDYGPYGWLEDFDPDWTPNTTDAQGRRYRFGHQDRIAMWNLAQLAGALMPLVGDEAPLMERLDGAWDAHLDERDRMWAAKLGLNNPDRKLVDNLLKVLCSTETDMTIFLRKLADLKAEDDPLVVLHDAYYKPGELTGDVSRQLVDWVARYRQALSADPRTWEQRRAAMRSVNPKYVLRNFMAQEAIDLATRGDASRIRELLEVLRRPYDEQPENDRFALKRPEWARNRPGCSTLSCSS